MKIFKFNIDLYSEIFNLFELSGNMIAKSINPDSFTEENLDKIEKIIKEIIEHPIIEDAEVPIETEEITCFGEETNKILNKIFSDKDLLFYGHGGRAKEIIDSKFICHYPNLLSHFIQLSCDNESLEKMKHWPHKGCPQVAIMALNIHEYNPIYEQRESKSIYDTDIYSIPNEYFVGYYDAERDVFVLNPNFKKAHEYNPNCELYQDEQIQTGLTPTEGPEVFKKIYRSIELIRRIMFFSSYHAFLDEKGYQDVTRAIMDRMKKVKDLFKTITPEFIEEVKQEEKNKRMEEITPTFEGDPWGLPDVDDDAFWDDAIWMVPEVSDDKNKKKRK